MNMMVVDSPRENRVAVWIVNRSILAAAAQKPMLLTGDINEGADNVALMVDTLSVGQRRAGNIELGEYPRSRRIGPHKQRRNAQNGYNADDNGWCHDPHLALLDHTADYSEVRLAGL